MMLLIITVITAAGKTWFVVMFSPVGISLVLIKDLNQGNQCCWSILGQMGMKNYATMPQIATDLVRLALKIVQEWNGHLEI